MQWYYAVGSERRGPLEAVTFNGLVNNGTIKPETLVWHTGMAEWRPWSVVAPTVTDIIRPASEAGGSEAQPPADTPWPGQSPAPATDAALSIDGLWAKILQRGYHTSATDCITRAWQELKDNYWGALGTTLLFMLISGVAQQIPLLGIVAAFLVVPQMTAGIWWYFIRRTRGEAATVSDIFAGFQRGFGQLALLALFQTLLMLPVVIIAFVLGYKSVSSGADPSTGLIAAIIGMGLVLGYILFRWQFAHALVIDRGYKAVDAIKLSWRIIGLRFWTLFGLALMLGVLVLLGLLALIVGMIFVMPLLFAAMVRAYEDAINPDA